VKDKQIMLIKDNPDHRDLTFQHSRNTTSSTLHRRRTIATLGGFDGNQVAEAPLPSTCHTDPIR
jgi:hypothetical protein